MENQSSTESPAFTRVHPGSCHCGAVRFEAALDLSQSPSRCNCSICLKSNNTSAIAKPDAFRLLEGAGELTSYAWGAQTATRYFCKHCGVRAFGIGTETPIGKMYGVNLGCLEGVAEEELARVPITYVDGRSDRWQSAPEFFAHL